MRGNSQFCNSILWTISLAVAVALLVLLSAVPAWSQNPVPPTARDAAALPAFAAKLHPATRPAMSKLRGAGHMRGALGARQSLGCGSRVLPACNSEVGYDNGPANGTTDAFTINNGYIVSNSFYAGGGNRFVSFGLYAWEFPGDTMNSLQWSITSAPSSGTVYGSGTVSGRYLTDRFLSTNQYGYDIDVINATVPELTLLEGSNYWINLFNASVPSGNPVFWDENSGVGCTSAGCPSTAYDSSVGTIASEAFYIGDGGPPPVPTCYGSGGKFQIIHDFTGQEAGTNGPTGGVTMDEARNLYGMTSGGVNGQGLAYRLFQKGQDWVLNPLYSFVGGSSGFGPAPVILGPDRALYGTAQGGNQNCYGEYCGLVYSLRPAPTACLTALCRWIENVLYEPAGLNDASLPGNLVFDQAGNLYGTSAYGGSYTAGAVFELTPSNGGWTEKIVYEFKGGSDGGAPNSLLLGNDGNFYGTAWYGGTYGAGVVFQLVPSGNGWTETVLYNFQDTQGDGGYPYNLIQDGAGNLYGTSGFDPGGGFISGIVFMLSPFNGKWVFTEISMQSHYEGVEDGGEVIHNLTIDAAENLYGTAQFKLTYSCAPYYGYYAYIFKLVPQGSGWQLTYPAPFGSSYFDSSGSLALDAQGNLYGTSANCGQYGYGTVWKVSP